MFDLENDLDESLDKPALYARLAEQAEHLLIGERDPIANAANLSALLFHALSDVNWCGFYLFDGEELVVGPFQGRPACVRIEMGSGVCGTAARDRRTLVVPDVNRFPGHIACDANSRSEIVVPLLDRERLIGVLDLDSPTPNRFDDEDAAGLERLAAIYLDSLADGERPCRA